MRYGLGIAYETPDRWFGNNIPQEYYSALSSARGMNKSVPFWTSLGGRTGINVIYVNPNGTMGRVFDWDSWDGILSQKTKDGDFDPAPISVWQGFASDKQIGVVGQQHITNTEAVIASSQAASKVAVMPDTSPSSFSSNVVMKQFEDWAKQIDTAIKQVSQQPNNTTNSVDGEVPVNALTQTESVEEGSWITGNMFGVPNLLLVAGGVLVIYMLGGKR